MTATMSTPATSETPFGHVSIREKKRIPFSVSALHAGNSSQEEAPSAAKLL